MAAAAKVVAVVLAGDVVNVLVAEAVGADFLAAEVATAEVVVLEVEGGGGGSRIILTTICYLAEVVVAEVMAVATVAEVVTAEVMAAEVVSCPWHGLNLRCMSNCCPGLLSGDHDS